MADDRMTQSSDLPHKQVTGNDDESSPPDPWTVLVKHKNLILGLPFVVALLAAGVSLLLPNIYTGIARILPPQQTQSTSALLSQLGSLAGLAGAGTGVLKNPNDLYVGMLKSRTVADTMILRFDLNKVYDQKFQSDTRNRLQKVTSITAGRDGIITIAVDDEKPKRAAEMANAYVDGLLKLTSVLAVTEASQRRLFFERQTIQAKDNLVKAEVAVKRALEHGGLVAVEAQGRTVVEAVARLRAQISVKEVEIGAMRIFASENNPKLKRAQQELEVMKREVAKSEGVGANPIADINAGPNRGIDTLGLLRDVKYYETMYELLARQLEVAKLDEAKDSTIIQVIDSAIEPDRRSKPKRTQIVLLSALAALCISLFWAFVREGRVRRNHRIAGLDSGQAGRLKELEQENAGLRRVVVDLSLDKATLKDVAQRNV